MRAIGLPEILAMFVLVAVVIAVVIVSFVNAARPATNKIKFSRVILPSVLLGVVAFGLWFALVFYKG